MLSSNLEKTLRNAYQLATDSKHEFVTLEHLLKSLTDDKDALSVLKACGVEIEELKINLEDFDALVTDCQGADYFVLKSFGELINHFSYINSEVMISEIYEGLRMENEINQFLDSMGFTLISNLEYKINNTQRDNIYENRFKCLLK